MDINPLIKFNCSLCSKVFSVKGNLTRHCKTVHNMSIDENKEKPANFSCHVCTTTFTTKASLKRHYNEKHCSKNENTANFSCPACQENFTRLSSLTRHIDTKHKGESGECSMCTENFPDLKFLYKHIQDVHTATNCEFQKKTENYLCEVCSKSFTLKQNLNAHMLAFHEVDVKLPASIKCPLCEALFRKAVVLDKHLVESHNIELKEEDIIFDSIEGFKKWKREMEREAIAFFYFKRSVDNKTYYECHRSGTSETVETGQKFRWKSCNKIGKNCPARIVATSVEGSVHVHFQKTHVGHTQSMKYLRLTKDERDGLAGKIKIGVPFDRILDDIRESVTNDINNLHLISKRDLHNIVRDYNLDRDKAHQNDAFSVEMWVKEQQSLGENSPVLYFKMQGHDDEQGVLSKDDFMIVLMTTYQREILLEYTSDKVCVDSTHGTTAHDFQLTTLVTVDNFGAGCPFSFCISNRVNNQAMSQFFRSVRSKVGVIKAKVLMTDDAPAYINAWTAIMSKPDHHLLCNWHIDENWRNNLCKIKDKTKQSEVYRACRALMECLDIEQFVDSLVEFLLMCEEDPDTEDYGVYFKKQYSTRAEKWAFCFRIGLSLNTNMFLEAMHKKFKYCYMEGHRNRRVDKCIALLMRFARDMMFERIIRLVKNKPTYRMQQISASHHRSEDIEDSLVDKIDDNTWLVKSKTPGRGPYTVSINNSSNCSGCPLSCPKCHVCVHKFTCTCIDYQIKGNFCKHVHVCIRISTRTDIFLQVNENAENEVLEHHNAKVIESAKGPSVHVGSCVSNLTRLETLVQMTIGTANTATEEAVSKAIQLQEKIFELLNQNQVNQETTSTSISHFPDLPENLPSHQSIEKQRFKSTKKQRATSSHRLAKPTDMQKNAVISALNDSDHCSEVIHTDFDHSYHSSCKSKSSQNSKK